MSTEILVKDEHQFKEYLRENLTSDLVLQVLEECLVEENSSYAALNFEQSIRDLQRRDTGRYYLLKALLEGYATKEGQVLLDPKLVNDSFRERQKELERLKSMSRARRFFYRLSQAVISLLNEKGETEAIQEAIQITGEIKIARDELAFLEAKKAQTISDTNQALTDAVVKANQILLNATDSATKNAQKLLDDSLALVDRERGRMYEVFSLAYDKHVNQTFTATRAMREQAELEREKLANDELLVLKEESKRTEHRKKLDEFLNSAKENTRKIIEEYKDANGPR